MKKSEILQELLKCDGHEVTKFGYKNGTNRLAENKIATNLQCVKKNTQMKPKAPKGNKMKYVCITWVEACSHEKSP